MTGSFGSPGSREVIRSLQEAGYEAVFVGGAVRDFALGKKPSDVDIATSATPQQVKQVFTRTIDVGIEHGTVLVLIGGEPIEVTTYRTDGTYADHRRPDEVHYVTSLKEDLRRRDFTINALAMTATDEMIDLFGGLRDLDRRLIRCVGNPLERFEEDPLRIFRALRFAAVLDFHIEEQTLEAMKTRASQLEYIAVERIKVEMDKLFSGKNPSAAFRYGREIGLPELFPAFFASFERLDEYTPFIGRAHGWAAFLYAGGSTPADVSSRFKLSNEEKRFLKRFEEAVRIRADREFSDLDLYRLEPAELSVAGLVLQANHPQMKVETYEELLGRKESLPVKHRKELAFTGNDLLTWSGLRGGQWTSEWIGKIEEAVVCRQLENDAQAIKEWFLHEISREK